MFAGVPGLGLDERGPWSRPEQDRAALWELAQLADGEELAPGRFGDSEVCPRSFEMIWPRLLPGARPRRAPADGERFGEDRARDLLPTLRRLEDEFYESEARYTVADLAAMGDRAAAQFRALHPELTRDAIEAFAWCYSFDYK